jgi:lipopolysaccharide export system permease protein
MIRQQKISPTLSAYLARLFTLNFIGMSGILLGVIWFFDVAELLRRAAKVDGVPLGIILQMAFLKLPEMAQTLFPFITLFTALFSFWQLSKRSELIVMRSAGISVWQFLRPILMVGFTAGLLIVTILNPLGALFFQKYSSLEERYLGSQSNTLIALFDEGLWLRQPSDTGYAIIHANHISLPDWRLNGVFALYFDDNDQFQKRLDAKMALLKQDAWQFQNVLEQGDNIPETSYASITLPTSLTKQDIENSFASPDTMGFWSLPNFIQTLERTGFDSTKLRIHFHTLIALPILCCAMILLAALAALRPQRSGGTFLYIVGGVIIGFVLFFSSNVLQALGASHQVPVFLAAWTPTLLSILIGSTILLMQEDG